MFKTFVYKVSIFFALTIVHSHSQNCNETQFRCDNGFCVDSKLKCDGSVNCLDGSDEDFTTCRTTICKRDQFQCTYGACVKSDAACDGKTDCADNSDELQLKCRNETSFTGCLQKIINDDHAFIRPSSITTCENKTRTCKDGKVVERHTMKCDGVVDCMDGSDESLESCASELCLHLFFRCKYGACINPALMCNGVNNCADGSDELELLCHTDKKGLCVLPMFPKNGYYVTVNVANAYPGQTFETVYLNYSCHSGYKLVGTQYQYCVKGQWSENPPKCLPQCLLKKHPSVEYLCLPKDSDSLEGVKECEDAVEDGTVVRPKCREPNYYYSGVLVNMHCTDGVWDQITTCSPQCGLVTAKGEQLIAGGRFAIRGELPWHVGIYRKTTRPYKQICGGSLVSRTLVISAAHCFWTTVEKKLPASQFAVAIGKLYRPWDNPRDEDAQKSDVREIKIPPRFQGSAANFQEDIALLILETPFEFRTYVRPVCVDFDFNFERRQLVVGAVGKVAGWGLTSEDGLESPVLQVIELPFVDIEQCISASPLGFIEYITSDKICAGVINGTTRAVCRGDSGGGLSFLARERGSERYFLRGLVSTAPTNEHMCNTRVYTTFTQISKHEEFIKKYL